jgi:4-O-beta-D-mannosyl-D-glucose phosphorylase
VPEGYEYIGDVMNVAFSNGWIVEEMSNAKRQMSNDKDTRRVFIYYASADTRLHVATTTVDQLLDYCLNTPEDGLNTSASVDKIKALVAKNRQIR